MDCDPFARLHVGAIDDGVKRGHETTAHRGCLDELDARGQANQVQIRERHADEMAKSAGIREAGEQRREAYVGLPVAAVLAGAVALAERNDDAIALLEVADVLADFLDHAAELVAKDCARLRGQAHPRPVARPCMPVGAADAVGLDANDRAVGGALRVGNGFDDQRFFRGFKYCCFH